MGAQVTDAQIDKWGEDRTKWQDENKHLPNLGDVETMKGQLRIRRDQMISQQGGTPGTPNAPVDNAKLNSLEAKFSALEVKIDKIMSHFGVK